MIREETSLAVYQKSGAKKVKLQRRSRAARSQRHHPLFIHRRLTCGIGNNTNYLSRILVPKLHDNMQQTDAGSVSVNDCFRNPALILQLVQALLRLLKLLFERFAISV